MEKYGVLLHIGCIGEVWGFIAYRVTLALDFSNVRGHPIWHIG